MKLTPATRSAAATKVADVARPAAPAVDSKRATPASSFVAPGEATSPAAPALATLVEQADVRGAGRKEAGRALVAALVAQGAASLTPAQKDAAADAVINAIDDAHAEYAELPVEQRAARPLSSRAVEWGAVSADTAPETDVRSGIAALLALGTPKALHFASVSLAAAGRAGARALLENPEAARAVFTNWLETASQRIATTDFSVTEAQRREGRFVGGRHGSEGYMNLEGERNVAALYPFSAQTPAELDASPALLLLGSNGSALGQAWVDTVVANEAHVAPQAAQQLAFTREEARQTVAQRVAALPAAERASLTPNDKDAMVQREVEDSQAMWGLDGNAVLDSLASAPAGLGSNVPRDDAQAGVSRASELFTALLGRLTTRELKTKVADVALDLLGTASRLNVQNDATEALRRTVDSVVGELGLKVT